MTQLGSIPEDLPSPSGSYAADWDRFHGLSDLEVLSDIDSESCSAVRVPIEYLDPISLQRLMTAPVYLLQTAGTCDRDSFLKYLASGGMRCPVTGVLLQQPVALQPNYLLQYQISNWAAANGIPYVPASYAAQECTVITHSKKPSRSYVPASYVAQECAEITNSKKASASMRGSPRKSVSRILQRASSLLGT